MLALSVLDQSPVRSGESAAAALAETVALAAAVDRLGYRRYWLAEHHNTPGLAGSAPEIMIARVAAATRHMRVGSGGVMLSHYSPYKVAEQFRLLEALFPGRIDLGIGRAPGSDPLTAMALGEGVDTFAENRFPRQLKDLFDYLRDTVPPDHPFARVHARPMGETEPEIWLLGSSNGSATLAAYFGQAFCFAHFITGDGGPLVMRAYREHFRPSPSLAAPRGSIGVHVICAPDPEEASRLAMPRDLWRLRAERGIQAPIPSLEEALAHPYSEAERARIAYHRRRQVIGTPEECRARLAALAAEYEVDEVVAVTITPDFESRLRSYRLLAEAFGLAPPGERGPRASLAP